VIGPSVPAAGPLDALLVGYEDRENLGLRYLLSSLHAAGLRGEITRYRSNADELVAMARRERPRVIGFSLIFQYMAPDFASVIRRLRDDGYDGHVTMGGHYPSFDTEEILRRIPGLDSVVRFEGEQTLVELAQRLRDERDWHELSGIAHRRGDRIVINPLRSPIHDLDTLPPPDRRGYDYESETLPTAAILGSRGCPWNCTFCSIRPFYEAQGGSLRRFRRPEAVVAEMLDVYRERRVPLFLFQDDDFLAGGRKAREWAHRLADAIVDAGLAGKTAFKISCRSDEIDRDCIEHLQLGGLTHVYMGVEAGAREDLEVMNKHLDPERHLAAGEVLRALDMSFDFGFMLLQPYSTFDTIRSNIRFLDEFVGDGWSVAGFCRMLPYAGTPIKTRLEKEGRMRGDAFEPDYRFLDPRLDLFYDWMLTTFHTRNFTSGGLCHILRAMLFEAGLNLPSRGFTETRRSYLRHLTSVCNRVALYTLGAALDHVESSTSCDLQRDPAFLRGLTAHESEQEDRLTDEVAQLCASLAESRPTGADIGAFDKTWTLAPKAAPALEPST
jgi:radical SAM superfamily enzyme YgiQ (UPF0313 family)